MQEDLQRNKTKKKKIQSSLGMFGELVYCFILDQLYNYSFVYVDFVLCSCISETISQVCLCPRS